MDRGALQAIKKSDMNVRTHTHNLTFSFVYSGVTGHLGSFHVLAITNSAAVSVRVYLSFQIRVCIFSGHMPRSGVGGSCACLVTQSCLTLCDPLDYSLPVSSVHRFLWQEYWSGLPFPLSGDLPNPGIEPMSPVCPALQADCLSSEPLRKTTGSYGSSIFTF